MGKLQLTINILVVSLSIFWIIAGIINYFIIKNYTNNKKVIYSFACSGFLDSLILSFYGFIKLIDSQQIKTDLKKEFSCSKALRFEEYDWIEENKQIEENGQKVITKNFSYQNKLIKVETIYEPKNSNDK